MNQTFYDRFAELKNDAADFIENKVLCGKKSNGLDVQISSLSGKIDRIEMGSAGCYVRLNNIPVKLRELQNEIIIQIAAYIEGSWDGEALTKYYF